MQKLDAQKPDISILMHTYNHVRFIAQAIESVLMQETEYSYQLVIGDDCSTDGASELIKKYAENFPDRIKLIAQPFNVGGKKNFMQTYNECSGEFIAFLDGDDYWTTVDKLQTQVEYLTKHPEVSLCFHDVDRIREVGGAFVPYSDHQSQSYKPFSDLADCVQGFFYPPCTLMLRRACLPELPPGFENLEIGDWPISIFLAEKGLLGYIDKRMATHRTHGNGAWSGASQIWRLRALIEVYEYFDEYFQYRLHSVIKKPLADHYLKLADAYLHSLYVDSEHVEVSREAVYYCLKMSLRACLSQAVSFRFWRLFLKCSCSKQLYLFLKTLYETLKGKLSTD